MASIEELQAAVTAASQAITDLVAHVQAHVDAPPAPEADYQAEVDTLNAATAQAQTVLVPPPAPAPVE